MIYEILKFLWKRFKNELGNMKWTSGLISN